MSPFPNQDALKTGPKELQNPGLVLLTSQTPNGSAPLSPPLLMLSVGPDTVLSD